jgi:hypothetical protein
VEVVEQVLGIDGKAVAESGWFGRLDMGMGHDGQFGRLVNPSSETGQQILHPHLQQPGRFAHTEDINIVSDIGAGRSPVDNAAPNRTLFGVSSNLGHDIVPGLFFYLQGPFDVDIVNLALEVGTLFGRNQTGLVLG